MLKLSGLVFVASIGILAAGSAAAQTWTVASGETRSAAVRKTNEAARITAKAEGVCYVPVQESFCRTDASETWSCIAKVTKLKLDKGEICQSELGRTQTTFQPLDQISPWVIASMQAKENAANQGSPRQLP